MTEATLKEIEATQRDIKGLERTLKSIDRFGFGAEARHNTERALQLKRDLLARLLGQAALL